MNNKTYKELEKRWKYAIQQNLYREEDLLGIFTSKSSIDCNSVTNNDIIYEIFFLPSFSEFCLTSEIKISFLQYSNSENIHFVDIRTLKEKINFKNAYLINPKYSEIFSSYIEKKDIDNGIVEILKLHFFKDYQKIISKKDFFKQLTHAEEKAYYSIIDEIGEEGNISISKLTEKYRISRPVYNNLIVKLKENKIAEIVNMGVKGTYIKIIHPELKSEIK